MKLFLVICVAILAVSQVNGHGALLEPPGRASLHRFPEQFGKYDPEPNYNDNQLFCGGFAVRQMQLSVTTLSEVLVTDRGIFIAAPVSSEWREMRYLWRPL